MDVAVKKLCTEIGGKILVLLKTCAWKVAYESERIPSSLLLKFDVF